MYRGLDIHEEGGRLSSNEIIIYIMVIFAALGALA